MSWFVSWLSLPVTPQCVESSLCSDNAVRQTLRALHMAVVAVVGNLLVESHVGYDNATDYWAGGRVKTPSDVLYQRCEAKL